MDLKEAGNPLYIVGETKAELGGAEYYHLHGELGASVPKLEPEKNIEAYKRIGEAMDAGYVRACHDLSEGGLGVAAAEMTFTGGLGLDIDVSAVPGSQGMRDDFILFSESNGRLLVEVAAEHGKDFESVMGDSVFAKIGEVGGEKMLTVGKGAGTLFKLSLDDLMGAWKTPLEAAR
jgi:phosphoribosylformylglycinamidine synthase